MTWEQDQQWESEWWGNCLLTFCEETKQISYAHRMGLVNTPQGELWPVYDMQGRSVLDIGGGPVSILLKAINVTNPTVVDPCSFPDWVSARYEAAGIHYVKEPGETFQLDTMFDEVWIYNVLQHVMDPEQLIKNAKAHTRRIRILDVIDIPPCPGHPHELKAATLDRWLGGHGTVEQMNENSCYYRVYHGVFEKENA